MQRPCGVKQPGESEELNIKQGNSGDEGREAAGGGGGKRCRRTLLAALSVFALSATESHPWV